MQHQKIALTHAVFITLLILVTIFSQYKYSFLHILTLGAKPFVKEGCPLEIPDLKLKRIKECSELEMISEPCVVRKAANNKQIQEFVNLNQNQEFTLKIHNSGIGNPMMTPLGVIDPDVRLCTLPDLLKNSTNCYGAYNGFKSLNYSSFEPFDDDNFERSDYDRADIFLGNLRQDMSTAAFHSNNFERSYTLQVIGEKTWLMMQPYDFNTIFETYCLGSFNAMANPCLGNLNKVQLQTVHTYPGDALFFPKAWPHMIYSKAGPNVMINFRNFDLNLFRFRDVIALASGILGRVKGMVMVDHCPNGAQPSSYGHGHPKSHPMNAAIKTLDFRCVDLSNKFIFNWAKAVRVKVRTNEKIDAEIYKQINEFNQFI